jgi:hypothetical protein
MPVVVKYWLLPDEENPVAKFKYVGSEQFKDESVTFYGCSFKRGEVTEVPDEYAANKLRNHFEEAFEEVEGDEENGAPKKRGRPKKTDEEREAEKAEREADKAQRDAEKARREQERADAKAEKEEVVTDVGTEEPWDDPEQV